MRILISLTILSLSLFNLSAQKKHFDIGALGGASYYLGEINQSRQFYKPSPSLGTFARLNLNNRESLRLSFIYMGVRGQDADFNNPYQQLRNARFNSTFFEIASTFEFNFLPYVVHKKERGFSPYLFGGLGYLAFVNSPGNKGSKFTVPFGVGAKYSLSKKIGIGLEWGMRKTFNDNLEGRKTVDRNKDGITNPGDENVKNPLKNNDWYSFAGFFISFRLNDNSGDCPVYW